MKKIILTVATIFAFGVVSAQEGTGFSKGNVFVSGAVGFSSDNDKNADVKTNGFVIEPRVGYFLTENIAIGGKLGYGSEKEDTAGTTTSDVSELTLGAFGRYYFTPASQFSLFAGLGVDYTSATNNLGAKVKQNGLDVNLGAGLNYFVSSNFSLEAGVGVLGFGSSKSDVSGDKGSSSFGFGGDWRAVTFGVNYKF